MCSLESTRWEQIRLFIVDPKPPPPAFVSKVFSLGVDIFSEGALCAGKRTGSHKCYIPYRKRRKIYKVYQVNLSTEFEPSGGEINRPGQAKVDCVMRKCVCRNILKMIFSVQMIMKMPTIVGIFIFISKELFMLSYFNKKEFAIFGNLRFISRTNLVLS